MDRVLFCSGVMVVSKNGIEPPGHVSATVNLMELSVEFMCCRTSSLCTCCMVKVLLTYLFRNLVQLSAVHNALVSHSSIY